MKGNNAIERIWIRLGGWVSAKAEDIQKIKDGNEDALVNALHERGFHPDGESYIPDNEMEFNIDPDQVMLESSDVKNDESRNADKAFCSIMDEYHEQGNCAADFLAMRKVPVGMSIEDAFLLYVKVMKTVEGDVFTVNKEDGVITL